MYRDILERLRVDPGQRTVGQLLQDREAAANEIQRLRIELEKNKGARKIQEFNPRTPDKGLGIRPAFRAGSLLRLADVRELLGISRSTVYKLLSEGRFPEPVRLGTRTVRWRVEAIEAWRDGAR